MSSQHARLRMSETGRTSILCTQLTFPGKVSTVLYKATSSYHATLFLHSQKNKKKRCENKSTDRQLRDSESTISLKHLIQYVSQIIFHCTIPNKPKLVHLSDPIHIKYNNHGRIFIPGVGKGTDTHVFKCSFNAC